VSADRRSSPLTALRSVVSTRPRDGQTLTGSKIAEGARRIVSFVTTNDGGCENPRPLACCDGYPPQ
jgi:hypothetical protein